MKRLLVTISLSAVILGIIWCGLPGLVRETTPVVHVVSPSQATVYETASCSGVLQSVHTARLSIGSPAEITEICVEEGEAVSAGQPLLKYRLLSSDELARDFGNTYIREIHDRLHELNGMLSDASILSAAEYAAVNGELPDYFRDFYLPATGSAQGSESGVLYAPFDGTVTLLNHLEIGEITSGLFVSAVVDDISHLVAKLHVPEAYLSKLQIGQSVNISGSAFGDQVFAGAITEISPYAVTSGGLLSKSETYIDATATLFTSETLMSGLTVKGCIFLNEYNQALIIPHSAITLDESRQECVYQCIDGHAIRRLVAYEYENDEGIVVSGDFSKDDLLIENPSAELFDGMPIRIAEQDEGARP